MRPRTLILLIAVAAVAVLATMMLERGPVRVTDSPAAGLLYPALKEQLNDIEQIRLSTGEKSVSLEKTGTGWIVPQKGGYAADSGKIRQMLLRLAETKILETKTSNPDLYPRLGVADQDAEDGAGTLLSLGPPADARLVVGNRDDRAGGTYVRRAGESASYLVGTEIPADASPLDWVDREVLDIDSASVRKLTIRHSDGEVLELLRVGDQLVAAGVPEGRELSGPGATQPMARLLSPLRLDDVQPASEFDAADPQATVDVHLDDGQRITARAWQTGEERWMAFDVTLDPAEPTAAAHDGESAESEGDPSPSDKTSDEPLTPGRADPESVARQDAALAGWVYRVPVYKYDQAVRRMEDLLKPLED